MNQHPRRRGYDDLLVAMVCHDTTLGLQKVQEIMARLNGESIDDYVITGPFADLHPDLRDAAVEGVRRARTYGAPLSPRVHHNAWVEFLAERGWRQGPVKNPARKIHPNLVAWDRLDPAQRDKDRVFLGIVVSMTIDAEAA